jgi:integrase/recombinase XerD
MKLSTAIDNYVRVKQAIGQRFVSGAETLKGMRRHCGDVHVDEVTVECIQAFLQSKRKPGRFRFVAYYAVAGFFRFAVARGYTAASPAPAHVRTRPKLFVPFIYTEDQVRRITLAAYEFGHRQRSQIDPDTFRALILLLYGTGLRIGEALSLTLRDVNLEKSLLLIRDSKFYKTRWVPMGDDVKAVISTQVERRRRRASSVDAPLFATRRGRRFRYEMIRYRFALARAHAGVTREVHAVYQPRIHDLRHSFAVRRVISWYREGADLHVMLPRLATYLGHVDLEDTQRYLTLTPTMLHEASLRFERYAEGDRHE